MSNKPVPFEETKTAAALLQEFASLSKKSRPLPQSSDPATNFDPTANFFNKDILTMSDFLGPIGAVIKSKKPAPEKKKTPGSVTDFLASSFATRKPFHQPDDGWVADEEITFDVFSVKPKPKVTISEFFGKIGGQ